MRKGKKSKDSDIWLRVDWLLDGYLYKEDVQDLARALRLPVSGDKKELIKRIMDWFAEDHPDRLHDKAAEALERTLRRIDKEMLKNACEDAGLDSRGTKEQLQDRVIGHLDVGSLFDGGISEIEEETTTGGREIEESELLPPPPEVQAPAGPPGVPETVSFDDVLFAIQRWIPLRRHPKEDGYQVDLHRHLEKSGYSVHLEQGDTLADIVVNRKIPIELKKNPTLGEYDRLHGQLSRHVRKYGCAIAVVCDVDRKELFDDFVVNAIRDFGQGVVEIVSK
jgi:cell wall assembly regulator SMI1